MNSYNLAMLERELSDGGWTVRADNFVVPQEIPGQVFKGGYQITLVSPVGDTFVGEGATRSDALRSAAGMAGQLPDGVRLI